MLTFVDESGDTGFRFGCGSSPFFTVTLVLFRDVESAKACTSAIDVLRRRSGRRRSREYRFSSCNHSTRMRFLKCVTGQGFEYASIVVNKKKLYGKGFTYKNSFIKCVMKYVFSNVASVLRDAKVVVDSTGDRDFRRTLQTYLKQEIKPDGRVSPISQVRMRASHSDNLIQLADMICGAVAHAHADPECQNTEYEEIVRKHRRSLQEWPK